MGRRHRGRPTVHLIAAHEYARRLRRELRRLIEGAPDAHEVFLDLACDAEAIERVLACAVGAADELLQRDPAPTTRSRASVLTERMSGLDRCDWHASPGSVERTRP